MKRRKVDWTWMCLEPCKAQKCCGAVGLAMASPFRETSIIGDPHSFKILRRVRCKRRHSDKTWDSTANLVEIGPES